MESIISTLKEYQVQHNGLIGGKPGKIIAAVINVMKEIEGIGKNNRNAEQKFNYRSVDDVYNMIQPILAKNGIFCSTRLIAVEEMHGETKTGTPKIRVLGLYVMDLMAEDGSTLQIGPIVGEAADTGDKVYNKTLSIADKYLLLTSFKIPTDELKDPDGFTPEETEGSLRNGREAFKKKPESKPEPKTEAKEKPQPKAAQSQGQIEYHTPEQLATLRSYFQSGRMLNALGREETDSLVSRLKNAETEPILYADLEMVIKVIEDAK